MLLKNYTDFINENYSNDVINQISKHINLKITSYLDKGDNGTIYNTVNKDKIVKITKDGYEMLQYKSMIYKDYKHFNKYYNIYVLIDKNKKLITEDEFKKDSNLSIFYYDYAEFFLQEYKYIIVSRKIDLLDKSEKRFWVNDIIRRFYTKSFTDSEFMEYVKSKGDEFYKYFEKYVKQRKSIFEEAKKEKIYFDDIHFDNIGLYNGYLVNFDIGGLDGLALDDIEINLNELNVIKII